MNEVEAMVLFRTTNIVQSIRPARRTFDSFATARPGVSNRRSRAVRLSFGRGGRRKTLARLQSVMDRP